MANLLDRASVVLTPTAYNNGEVLCVKPDDGSGDFQFSRNSAATRVNSQGLVEDVQIISGNKVTNGDFSNGATGWGIEATWTISGGVANGNGANGGAEELQQSGVLIAGRTYNATYEVKNYVSGSVKLQRPTGISRAANGVYTEILTAATTLVKFRGANFNGSITNIVFKEITDDTNLPRINYEDGCGSWLFEPQSTNLIPYSENFNTWNNLGSRSIITLNSIISPDGTLNGTKQTQNAVSNSVRLRFSSILTIGTEYTFSVFAKKGNYDKLQMNISGVTTNFTLTDNWARYEITVTAPNNTFVDVGIPSGSIGDFIYLWGAQAEEQPYATSYIPTNGTSVTRNQDVCTGGGSAASINSTEGVLYAEISALANENAQRILSISDGTHNNTVKLGFLNSATDYRIFADIRLGGVNQAFLTFNFGAVAPTFKKCAIKYKQNDFALWIDGVEVATDTSGNTFSANTLNSLQFDRGNGIQNFYGKTKCLAVFPFLTDTELQELKTI